MPLNPSQKALRISKLETHHATVLTVLSSTPQTLATIAAAVGISADLAEKQLSVLIDEGLASRTKGDRVHATYVAV